MNQSFKDMMHKQAMDEISHGTYITIISYVNSNIVGLTFHECILKWTH